MADMDLLIHNAWSYYRPDAREYRDATTLQSVVRNALSSIPGAPLLNPIHAKEKYGFAYTWPCFHRTVLFSFLQVIDLLSNISLLLDGCERN